MLEKYLLEEWSKIEYNNKVLSIKNLCNKLSFIYGKPTETFNNIVLNYFKENDDAFFINSNQIIDKRTLKNRIIVNFEELKTILLYEYFIIDFDVKGIFLELVKENNKLNKKKLLQYPEEMFRNFYKATNRWNIIKNNTFLKSIAILNYLNDKRIPIKIRDIYLDLIGAPIEMTMKQLLELLNRNNKIICYDGYWTTREIKRDLSEQTEFIQYFHTKILKKSRKKLVNIYINNNSSDISINKMINAFDIIGVRISKNELESLLIEYNYSEIYPGYWRLVEEIESLGRFKVSKLWDLTCSNLIKNIKNKRNIEIFYKRIITDKTLESIGEDLKITRERVRQIENKLRRQMIHNKYSIYLMPFYNWFVNRLKFEKIIDLSTINVEKEEYKIFDFIMNNYFLNKDVYRILANIVIYKPEYDRITEAINTITVDKRIITIEDIPLFPGFRKKIDNIERVLTECIGSYKIDKNKYYYTGRKITNEEEIFLIIYMAGRPLHYTEVPVVAEKMRLPLSTQQGRNTLATMQRNHLLKRIAPGTYGLKEWDISKHIYISDLIYKVLEEAGKPLYYHELVSEIKRYRFDRVKERSIQYYLSNHDEVVYLYTYQYILVEWIEEPGKLTKYGIDIDKIRTDTLLHNNKVILEVIKHKGNYITKYRLSEFYKKTSSIRVSRYVNFNFARRIIIIDKFKKMHFQSYSADVITGINRWSYIPDISEVFYIEFISEKVARFLSIEDYNNYEPIEEDLLQEAESYWTRNMEELLQNEENDEGIIEEILSKESLFEFGLDRGYVYYETIEKLVDLGYNPRELLYELNDRGIIVNY